MDYSKFAPRVENTKTEKTGERSSAYSLWHRSLGPDFYAVDIDFVEYRADRGIVAFIAISGKCTDEKHIINSKQYIWERTKLERKILIELSDKINVPAFLVLHSEDLSVFHVHNLKDSQNTFKVMNLEEYSNFIKSL
jgi:hypothetical protein